MFKKKTRKPLFYKKSKAAEEYEKYGTFNETDGFQQPKLYKHSPSRIKNVTKYNKDFDYTGYDRRKQYIYDYENQMENLNDYDMFQHTTEGSSRYTGNPDSITEYDETETDETQYYDETDFDGFTFNNHRGQRYDYTSEYPSEYFVEEIQAPKRKNKHKQSVTEKRREIPEDTEMDQSLYQQTRNLRNYGKKNQHFYKRKFKEESEVDPSYGENPYHRAQQKVYLARAPVGHKAFRHQQQADEEQYSRSESEADSDKNYKRHEKYSSQLNQRKNQSPMFSANLEDDAGYFENQQKEGIQNTKEKLVSITEYDKSIPLISPKNSVTVKPQNENQTVVYLPVVVMNDSMILPYSKVIPAESIFRIYGDKAKKPLEANLNIYVATENGQGNIFQQAQKSATRETDAPENTRFGAAASNHSVSLNKKQSLVSKISRKLKTKSKSKQDFPVQKSYINVATSKCKPVENKESRTSIKSGVSKESKTVNKPQGSKISHSSSLVGLDKPKRPKGSAYYSYIHNKEINVRKERKKDDLNKNEDSDSVLISVVNPNSQDIQTDDQRAKTILSQKGELQNQKSLQKSVSQVLKKKPSNAMTSVSRGNLTKQSTLDRDIKQAPPKILKSVANDNEIITIKEVKSGVYEDSKNVFEQSKPDLPPTDILDAKKKYFGSSLFHKKASKLKFDHSKDQASAPQKCDPYTFESEDYNSPTPSIKSIRKKTTKADLQKAKNSNHSKSKHQKSCLKPSNETEKFQVWNVFNVDSSIFVYLFQAVHFFLGLSNYETLMEILRTFQQTD